jgi:hypothetical protein
MTDVLAPAPETIRSAPADTAVAAGDLRTRITFSRREQDDCEQRQIVIRLDGMPRIELLFGQAVTIDVDPGFRKVWIHNTLFWKTIRFAVEAGEHLEFAVVNRAGPMTLGLLAVLGVGPLFLSVRRRSLR